MERPTLCDIIDFSMAARDRAVEAQQPLLDYLLGMVIAEATRLLSESRVDTGGLPEYSFGTTETELS